MTDDEDFEQVEFKRVTLVFDEHPGPSRVTMQTRLCGHCGWPKTIHVPPGCPCFLCGEYGHRSVDCKLAREESKSD